MNGYDPMISLETLAAQLNQMLLRAEFLQDGNSQALLVQLQQKFNLLPYTLEPSDIFVPPSD